MFPTNLTTTLKLTTLITLTAISTLFLIPADAIPQTNSESSSSDSKAKAESTSTRSKSTTSKSQPSKSDSSSESTKSKSTKSKSTSSKSSDSSDRANSSDSTRSDSGTNSTRTRYTDESPLNSAAANQPINPQAFNDRMLSRLVFDLTNQERLRAGLQPFETSSHLAAAAAAHSRDMASRNYFNHKSKGLFNRTDPHERIASAGYQAPRMTAENIAMIPTFNSQRIQTYPGYGRQVVDADYNSYSRMAQYAVKQWMESPGHRENILNARLTQLGVGVAVGLKDNIPYVYLTQNFGG